MKGFFHPYVKGGDFGYVTDLDAYMAERLVAFIGGDARVSRLCAMVQTSDNSPIVLNVPLDLFCGFYPSL